MSVEYGPDLIQQAWNRALVAEICSLRGQLARAADKWERHRTAIYDALVERDDAEAALSVAETQLAVARDLLRETIDTDPCDLDHNLNCQAHMWFTWSEGREVCATSRAVEFLRG